MRRVVSLVVLGLGVLAVTAGITLRFYAYPALAKIPHNIESLSYAKGSGITALMYVEKPGQPAIPEIRRNLSLTSSTYVTADMQAPEVKKDGNIAVWIETSLVTEDSTKSTVNGSVRELCLDRFTAEAVGPCTNGYLQNTLEKGKDTRKRADTKDPQFPGLNFKFPFETEKKTYQWYDISLRKPIDAKFEAVDEIDGLEVYRFKQSAPSTNIDSREVPGSLVGQTENTVKAGLYYEVDRTIWIEPNTGAVIKLRQWSKQELRTDTQGPGSGTVVFDGALELDGPSVAKNVSIAKENMSQLWLLTGLPVILWIVGGVLTLAGIVMLVLFSRRRGAHSTS
ncbi:hypothetical protein JOF56_010366 [Kibdelosporangium banguiense]|uniref:DUF3068 domain-containing protein n=1 Tax=Kibdelosporangium banguiense TaxID=1365924 RepID=A0ABS4U1B0_9PSEU|nr:DUF3068 domain-containing protein [Kibdelosporangium banguiense]MBP2329981.1 hypothetical protein [Kibdelosporangium banguiense]